MDEYIPLLSDLANRFKLADIIKGQLSEGAGFFILGPDKSRAVAEVKSVAISQFDDLAEAILSFLDDNQLSSDEIEMGFVGYNLSAGALEKLPFATIIYTDSSGRHFSSSAFGLHMASQYLQHYGKSGDHVIIINIAATNKFGLTLLQRV